MFRKHAKLINYNSFSAFHVFDSKPLCDWFSVLCTIDACMILVVCNCLIIYGLFQKIVCCCFEEPCISDIYLEAPSCGLRREDKLFFARLKSNIDHIFVSSFSGLV